MTSTNPSSEDVELLAELDHAHEHALGALDDPAANSLAAVTWASAHLAAVERVLYPVACRRVEHGRDLVREQSAVDHRLQLLLWQLDRRLTGDVHLGRVPVKLLEDGVRRELQAHADGEHRLVGALRDVLSREEQQELLDRLANALLRGPTRPHPDTRHGRLGGVAFWFDGVVDRMRDSMDSRSVPTPHRTAVPRPMTRWGAYALGTPLERLADAQRRD